MTKAKNEYRKIKVILFFLVSTKALTNNKFSTYLILNRLNGISTESSTKRNEIRAHSYTHKQKKRQKKNIHSNGLLAF